MAERIEVEQIARDQGVIKLIERVNEKLDKQATQLQKIGTTSKKAAEVAAGSFNALEKELRDAESVLKGLPRSAKNWDEQNAKVQKLRTSLGAAKAELRGFVGEQSKASQKASGLSSVAQTGAAKIGAMVAGLISINGVVTGIVRELEHAKTLRIEAAAASRTVEQALADLGQNIGGENIAAARQLIQQQAPELGVTQQGLANLIGTAISAGAKDLQQAFDLSASALKMTVGDEARAQALVGGTLDVASLGRSTNFEGALGQLLQVQSQVRSTNLSEFGANIGPGLAAATSTGATTERSLEIASVISQIIKDQTGSNTATTMRQFFTRLDSFVPELEKTLEDGGTAVVDQAAIDKFKQATTFDQKVAALQANEGIRTQFLETQRESIGKVAVREILEQSPRAVQFEQKAAKAITDIDDAQKTFITLIESVGEETSVLAAQRKSEANLQTRQTRGVAGREGQAEQIFTDTLRNIDLPGFDYFRREFTAPAFVNAGDGEASARVDRMIQAIEEQTSPTDIGVATFALSKEDRQYVQEQLALLRELRDEIRQTPRQQSAQIKVQAPPARPKESPLPVANVP